MSTERIYYSEPHQTEFEAEVVGLGTEGEQPTAILDRTAFYPTGGGQPHDTGRLGNVAVVDVVEREDGTIQHVLESSAPFTVGERVRGHIDGWRRTDHLQQHSGQHLLSAAFEKVAGAATLSFHLGAETSTIHLALDGNPEEVAEAIRTAAELADRIIAENRPMCATIVEQEEAQQMDLRKEVPVKGDVRLVSIEDFDCTPCGGTHALRTGEIRMVAVLRHERYKKGTRIEFVAGGRVQRMLEAINRESDAVGALISAPRGERVATLGALLEERKRESKRLRGLVERAAVLEAEVLASATGAGDAIRKCFEDRSSDEVAALARALADRQRVAILGVIEDGIGKVIVDTGGTPHAGNLVREVAASFGGRGGGADRFAQAGGLPPDQLEEVLRRIEEAIG